MQNANGVEDFFVPIVRLKLFKIKIASIPIFSIKGITIKNN